MHTHTHTTVQSEVVFGFVFLKRKMQLPVLGNETRAFSSYNMLHSAYGASNMPVMPVCYYVQEVTEELKNYQSVIEALHEQAASLGEQVCAFKHYCFAHAEFWTEATAFLCLSSAHAFSSVCFISGTSAVWNCSVSLSSCVINTEVIQLRRLRYKRFYHLFERVLYGLPVVAIRLQIRRHGSVLSTFYWHEPRMCKFCTSFTTEKQLLFSIKLEGGGAYLLWMYGLAKTAVTRLACAQARWPKDDPGTWTVVVVCRIVSLPTCRVACPASTNATRTCWIWPSCANSASLMPSLSTNSSTSLMVLRPGLMKR